MNSPLIRLKTENFRAIGKSDIIINGITVVAGENGSGKSTLSKLLYYLYKTISEYESLVFKDLKSELRDIERLFEIVQNDLIYPEKDKKNYNDLAKEIHYLKRNSKVPDEGDLGRWLSLIEKISEIYNSEIYNSENSDNRLFSSKEVRKNNRLRRIESIAKNILKQEKVEENEDFFPVFDKIADRVKSLFDEAFRKIKSRPTSLFKKALKNVFAQGDLPKIFEVFEFEEPIVSLTKPSLSIPYSIQNAIYIDSPMMIGVDMSDNDHWDDLNYLLSKKPIPEYSQISTMISKEIIQGDISYDEESPSVNDFSFVRADGSLFNLLHCATGIKSFGILQLLLKNGSLTDKTLLIIDEPEAHLHPQWIIEYARLIVLINKEIKTNFFIASHNPDMVSAIKYISEKEKVNQNLNFYLAEKIKDEYSYNYRHLGNDIEPIFESFNIAIERVNQYGI